MPMPQSLLSLAWGHIGDHEVIDMAVSDSLDAGIALFTSNL